MSRLRTGLPLAAALLVVTSSLVAPLAGADTSTTRSSTSTTPSTTSTSAPSPTSTSTTTTPATTTSTTARSTTSSSAPNGPTSTTLGSTGSDPASAPAITAATSDVPLFIVAGTPSQAAPGTLIEITQLGDVARQVTNPSAELSVTFEQFYDQGGGVAYLWLTSDEQADTLIAATAQIARLGTSADVFVIPGIAALDGEDYLDVASSLAALAQGQLGVALLDPPSTVVTAVQTAWPDVSALVTLADQVRTAVADPGSAALYAAPLVDGEGDTVPASVVMAGMLAAQDVHAGVWVPAAGTSITARDLDVVLPFTNVQLETFAMTVNAFRALPNYGTIMWGDRTLAGVGADDVYLSVDRTADWIHRSIAHGLEWAVFEPGDQATQDAVEASVSSFLTTTWHAGALVGDTATAAFQLSVGLEPPPGASAVGQGLWLQVGVALVRPAEFQWLDVLVPTASG